MSVIIELNVDWTHDWRRHERREEEKMCSIPCTGLMYNVCISMPNIDSLINYDYDTENTVMNNECYFNHMSGEQKKNHSRRQLKSYASPFGCQRSDGWLATFLWCHSFLSANDTRFWKQITRMCIFRFKHVCVMCACVSASEYGACKKL